MQIPTPTNAVSSLDERVQAFLETVALLGGPPVNTLSVAAARQRKMPGLGRPPELLEVRDLQIPVRHGQVTGRLYVPETIDSAKTVTELPLIIYFHGGGWVLGELSHYDLLCSHWANRFAAAIMSVDYRLAPECPFPGGLEDCIDAIRWLSEHAINSPQESSRPWKTSMRNLYVAGDSAGGNLAISSCLALLDEPGIKIRGQILLYPITDCNLNRPSYLVNGEKYLLTTDMMAWFWNHYCPDESQRKNPLCSPFRSARLAELPPTFMITCQFDPLVDEGNEFALKLKQTGISITHQEIPGMIHGFCRYYRTFPQAAEITDCISRWLSELTSS